MPPRFGGISKTSTKYSYVLGTPEENAAVGIGTPAFSG
jgi:hypothetical protein